MKTGKNENDTDEIIPYNTGDDFFIERTKGYATSEDAAHVEYVNTDSTIRTNVQRTEYNHSPTGFNFGYGGSGPADFALNLLLMVTDRKTAYNLHQIFKEKYIAGCKENRFTISRADVEKFITEQSSQKGEQQLELI